MIDEIFKTITDFPNYSVSTLGNVRIDFTGFVVKQYSDKDGYKIVSLSRNKKSSTQRVHRLVAKTYLPNYDNLPLVDHRNRTVDDNRLINLRWCNHSQNQQNAMKKPNVTSIHKGVHFHKRDSKWTAYIWIKKHIHLGQFLTEDEAKKARDKFIIDNKMEKFYSQDLEL